MAPIVLAFALAASVPAIDIESSCRPASNFALPEDRAAAHRSCVRDEQDARSEITRSWAKFTPAARAICGNEQTQFSPSYVDLLTCLEMNTGGVFSHGGGAAASASGTSTTSGNSTSGNTTTGSSPAGGFTAGSSGGGSSASVANPPPPSPNFQAYQIAVPGAVIGPAAPITTVVNVPTPSLPMGAASTHRISPRGTHSLALLHRRR